MRPKLLAVLRREYLERTRTPAFWISTLLIPLMVVVLFVVQIAATKRIKAAGRVAVVDLTGRLGAPMAARITAESDRIRTELELMPTPSDTAAARHELDRRVLDRDLKGYVWIPADALDGGKAEYASSSTSSDLIGHHRLEQLLEHAILVERLKDRGLPRELYDQAAIDVTLERRSVKTTAKTDTESAMWVALSFFTIMYISFFMYGAMIMNGVLEEKNNRIVEVVISSVRPTDLMLGKILGVGAVGFTQYAIWCVFAANLAALLGGPAAAAGMPIPRIPLVTLIAFLVFFVLGYLFYAALYAAMAAPFKTVQEASQFQLVPFMFLIPPMALWFPVVNEPHGALARIGSFVPPCTPLFMFLRVAVDPPPIWEIALSIVLLLASIYGMAVVAGRIYRVGILMYGKKPTLTEIGRWVREAG